MKKLASLLLLLLFTVTFIDAYVYFPFELFSIRRLTHRDPEIFENATEIIRNHGFAVEEHFVETDDGYILCLIRMRNRNISMANPKVVYLQHGLLDSAHTWINNLRNESLAFILADEGFDVWLGNSRGSTYSRKHRSLTTDHLEFWEFSWDHMARFDLPASINHVLHETNVSKISYVGHSQGCQIAFAQFDRDPVLQSRIELFIALAPVAFLGHMSSPIRIALPFAPTFEFFWDHFGHGEFLPSAKVMHFLAQYLCGNNRVPFVCSNVIFLIAGYDASNTNTTRLPVYVSHTPAGTSAQNMVHYCQSILSSKFQQYDYGKRKNMEVYGQPEPPEYDLSNFKVPTIIYNGGKDWLSVKEDVHLLIDRIKPSVVDHCIFDHYNHLDFVWGMDAPEILYPDVVVHLSGGNVSACLGTSKAEST